jgi:hypothetical protein
VTAVVDVPDSRADEVLRLVELDDLEVRRPTLEDVYMKHSKQPTGEPHMILIPLLVRMYRSWRRRRAVRQATS